MPPTQPAATASSTGPAARPETRDVASSTSRARTAEPVPAATVADASTEPAAKPPPAPDDSCDDLVALEVPAMMGQLGVGRRKCLERRLASESRQTMKNKISRVLIADAQARGDKADWERLMKRHLETIDRSDPNLCFQYAIQLSREGVSRAHGVIRWADYALENKHVWTGNNYKRNVYALYKLRALAANRLWQAAEKAYIANRTDANEAKSNKYRGMAKGYAREWLDYARASGQDLKQPLALCVEAAGSKEFCAG